MKIVGKARRIIGSAYERLLAPRGARAVEAMLANGLPPRLAQALRTLFGGPAPASAAEAAETVERLRGRIAARADAYQYARTESPLGPVRLAEVTQQRERALTSERLANTISVPKRWGMFLHQCAEAFDAEVIVEMGACVGISGAYLGSIPSRPRLFTLEGSQALADVAQQTLATISDRAEVVVGPFERTLQPTLARAGTVDVAFVDGHHEEAATIHYVAAIAEHLSPTALIVLDDIYLYEGMWRAWQKLSSDAGVAAVNVGRFGLLVRERGRTSNAQYDLSRYTGRWRVGAPRSLGPSPRSRGEGGA
jgi:predicted O-methyltransferase YrrM